MAVSKIKRFKTKLYILIFNKEGLLLENNDFIKVYLNNEDIENFVKQIISDYVDIDKDILNPEIVYVLSTKDEIFIYYKLYIPICKIKKGNWGSIYDVANFEQNENLIKKIFKH